MSKQSIVETIPGLLDDIKDGVTLPDIVNNYSLSYPEISYRLLHKYCKTYNIEFTRATRPSLIDNFPDLIEDLKSGKIPPAALFEKYKHTGVTYDMIVKYRRRHNFKIVNTVINSCL